MYGNEPHHWDDDLTGFDRLRTITNYFTRMRFCTENGALQLTNKGKKATSGLHPWFELTRQAPLKSTLVFGHWAALEGQVNKKEIYALDTGCYWGGALSAMCLQNKDLFRINALKGKS